MNHNKFIIRLITGLVFIAAGLIFTLYNVHNVSLSEKRIERKINTLKTLSNMEQQMLREQKALRWYESLPNKKVPDLQSFVAGNTKPVAWKYSPMETTDIFQGWAMEHAVLQGNHVPLHSLGDLLSRTGRLEPPWIMHACEIQCSTDDKPGDGTVKLEMVCINIP